LFSAISQSCPAGNTPCPGTETCIPVEWWCDGIVDCQNNTDEDNCGRYSSLFCRIPSFNIISLTSAKKSGP